MKVRTDRPRPGAMTTAVSLLVALLSLVVATGASDAPAQTPVRTGPQLQLVAQQFAIEADGTIRLTYRLTGLDGDQLELATAPPDTAPPDTAPPDTAPADTAPGTVIDGVPTTLPAVVPEPPVELTVLVTNYQPVTDPDDLAELVGSDVDPDAFRAVVDGVAITDLRTRATLGDDGTVEFTLDIGTDTLASVQDRLKFDQPGLYPLRIQLLTGDPADDNVVATAGTIVQRLPGPLDGVDAPPPVDLSVVTVTPSPGPTAPTTEVVAARAALDTAVDLAATIGSPVTLEVPPQLVADEAATEEGAQRLSESLENDELVALPIIPRSLVWSSPARTSSRRPFRRRRPDATSGSRANPSARAAPSNCATSACAT
jgi:hypothetical protein